MPTRLQVIAPIAAAAFIVGIVGIINIPSDAKLESVEFPRGMISIDGKVLEVQIADDPARKTRGLMFQERLPYDEGMLFVFAAPGYHSLWMLNMQFAIDMIWFDSDGKVVHIERDVQPCRTAAETLSCPSHIPLKRASYVLEVSSGFADEFGIDIGSTVDLISI